MPPSTSSIQFFTAFQLSDIWFLTEAAGRTLLIAALSISGGTVLGIFFGWVLSVTRWAGAGTLGLVLDVFRGVPLIIQLILFFKFFSRSSAFRSIRSRPEPSFWFFTPLHWSPPSRAAVSRL